MRRNWLAAIVAFVRCRAVAPAAVAPADEPASVAALCAPHKAKFARALRGFDAFEAQLRALEADPAALFPDGEAKRATCADPFAGLGCDAVGLRFRDGRLQPAISDQVPGRCCYADFSTEARDSVGWFRKRPKDARESGVERR